MSASRSVAATFDKFLNTLTVSKADAGSGSITSSPPGIDCGADCSEPYSTGTSVTLTAVASSGSQFSGWTGCDTVSGATCSVTMSAARNVTATFKLPFTLTVAKADAGSGTVTSDVAGINCGADCSESYVSGASVTLTAVAASGSKFTGWSGCDSVSGANCTVAMNAARTVTATFKLLYTLAVVKADVGTGTVTSTPAGIACGGDCSEPYVGGTSVTLTAVAAAGSRFTGWSGCDSVSGASCTLTMSAARTATATFKSLYTLSVTKADLGSGTVTANPAGITCGADCSEPYVSGTTVTLAASAAPGSAFTGWAGCDSAAGTTCTVTLTAARTVTATFKLLYTLTVAKADLGAGTVTASLAGINCGSDCSEPYVSGTTVTLTAVAASGSRFSGWSGCDSAAGASCTVTMSAARTVTATFKLLFTLTVNKSGLGNGTVTSSPGGISCGADCSEPYVSGTTVTLTVSPQLGSVFLNGWSGCDSVSGLTGNVCTVSMSNARSVTATFVLGLPF